MELMKLRDVVEASLPQITCPTLVMYSTADPTVTPEGSLMVLDRIASTDKEAVSLTECGHVMTLDTGWQGLAERTYRFFADRLPETAQKDAAEAV